MSSLIFMTLFLVTGILHAEDIVIGNQNGEVVQATFVNGEYIFRTCSDQYIIPKVKDPCKNFSEEKIFKSKKQLIAALGKGLAEDESFSELIRNKELQDKKANLETYAKTFGVKIDEDKIAELKKEIIDSDLALQQKGMKPDDINQLGSKIQDFITRIEKPTSYTVTNKFDKTLYDIALYSRLGRGLEVSIEDVLGNKNVKELDKSCSLNLSGSGPKYKLTISSAKTTKRFMVERAYTIGVYRFFKFPETKNNSSNDVPSSAYDIYDDSDFADLLSTQGCIDKQAFIEKEIHDILKDLPFKIPGSDGSNVNDGSRENQKTIPSNAVQPVNNKTTKQ